ncbi:hypothetical protein H9Q74_014524, partial [Fusarium xylarioides]
HTTVQSSNTLRHYTVTMPVRRSLQPAQHIRSLPTRCYQEVIRRINLFINRYDHADLRDMAMETGLTWQRKYDASRVKRVKL